MTSETVRRPTIYIPLLNEGTPVWRPTEGEFLRELTYRVLPAKDYNPREEHWEFPPGSIVICERRVLHPGCEVLIAVRKIF